MSARKTGAVIKQNKYFFMRHNAEALRQQGIYTCLLSIQIQLTHTLTRLFFLHKYYQNHEIDESHKASWIHRF